MSNVLSSGIVSFDSDLSIVYPSVRGFEVVSECMYCKIGIELIERDLRGITSIMIQVE